MANPKWQDELEALAREAQGEIASAIQGILKALMAWTAERTQKSLESITNAMQALKAAEGTASPDQKSDVHQARVIAGDVFKQTLQQKGKVATILPNPVKGTVAELGVFSRGQDHVLKPVYEAIAHKNNKPNPLVQQGNKKLR